MDSLASLALATEEPRDELLKRPPYRRNEYIISRKMAKHILSQGIAQAIVLFVVVFAGQNFLPEDPASSKIAELLPFHPEEKYRNWDPTKVFNGMRRGVDGSVIYEFFVTVTPSRHQTVTFTMFVFFQIFNMICARKINDEINIFEGLLGNKMFVIIWVIIVGGQFLITQFGGWAMKVHLNGLTGPQWGFCVGVGAAAAVFNLIAKFVPERLFPQLGDEDP
jgi:magnesium-transporting ATPase (P-type)